MRNKLAAMRRVKTIPVIVLTTSVMAIVMIAIFQARSDASRRAQAELGQMSTQLSESTFAPIGVMFGAPVGTVRASELLLKGQIQLELRDLRAGTPVPALAGVQRAVAGSFGSEDLVLGLTSQVATSQGRAVLARALAGDNPALNRLLLQIEQNSVRVEGALNLAGTQYASRAQSQRQQATIGSAAAIVLLVLAFVLAYRRSVVARADAERLAAENAKMAEASRREALTDPLTGLGNRRALVAALDEALHDTATEPVAIALFDLDGFKQYNDTFGHQAGDALLRRLGDRLADRLSDRAVAYRMGGDEFCVLARLDDDDAISIAHLAADALSESGDGFSIGCSYGIALAPSEASTAQEALRIADERMYEQKASGKRSSATQTTDALLQVLIERDQTLADHVSDVARLAVATAERLGMTDFEVRQVKLAAQLHDIGKSAIPDSILNKPGPLDDQEWQFIKRHTIIGERIVRAAPSISHAAELIRSSHERVDGTGYPDGLRGDQIPLGSRIIAVCDAFDAMIRDRPYHPRMPVVDALEELRRCAGTQFDAPVLSEFCQLAENFSGETRVA